MGFAGAGLADIGLGATSRFAPAGFGFDGACLAFGGGACLVFGARSSGCVGTCAATAGASPARRCMSLAKRAREEVLGVAAFGSSGLGSLRVVRAMSAF
jgi:hypothetical protein